MTEREKALIDKITRDTREKIDRAASVASLCRVTANVLVSETDEPLRSLLKDSNRSIIELLQICGMFGKAVDVAASENKRLVSELGSVKERNKELRKYLD